jgi:hypothetical protein
MRWCRGPPCTITTCSFDSFSAADVSLCPCEADFIEGNRKFVGMDSVSALSGVDCWFDPQSSQPKHYAIGICCFSSKLAAWDGAEVHHVQ